MSRRWHTAVDRVVQRFSLTVWLTRTCLFVAGEVSRSASISNALSTRSRSSAGTVGGLMGPRSQPTSCSMSLWEKLGYVDWRDILIGGIYEERGLVGIYD